MTVYISVHSEDGKILSDHLRFRTLLKHPMAFVATAPLAADGGDRAQAYRVLLIPMTWRGA